VASGQIGVVVAFSSRCGATEALAHAAAVGAVQGRALIRLRRLPDDGAPSRAQDSPECQQALARMRKEYVPPTEADITGNDALILAPPAGSTTDSTEWAEFVSLLTRLGSAGKLSGIVGAVIDTGSEETRRSFSALMASAGFRSVVQDGLEPEAPDTLRARATTCGRRVAGSASLRQHDA
jgi:hypothetical protein